MRIGIETSWACGEPTGIGFYVIHLLKALAAFDKDNTYYLLHYHHEWSGPDFGENFIPVSYRCSKASVSILFNLNKVLASLKCDIYHATAGTGVSWFKPPCPVITTVHDLYRFKENDTTAFLQRHLFRWQFNSSLKHSNHFIVNSQFTRDELCSMMTVDESNITVTHLAPAIDEPSSNYPLSEREHLICLGGIEERKGQYFLVQAYFEALKMNPDLPDLYFVGPDRGDGTKILQFAKANKFDQKIHITGYVSNGKKSKLLGNAKLCLVPSIFEGFGIPLLEANVFSTAVIASDIQVFKEIASDGAWLLALDKNLWAKEIVSLLADEKSLELLSDAGYKNQQDYTWEKCAIRTLNVYEEYK